MNVINCYSFYGLISIYDSSNLAFVTSNFTNNTGRVYSFKNCIVVLIGNIILNNICTFQNEIEACFLYASDGSQIMVNYTVAANIMNIKQGGAIYTIDSTLLLYVFKLTNTSSYHYGGCVMAEFSNVIIMNSGFLEYGGGCLFIKGSNLTLLMNSFSNSAYRNKLLTYGSTLACVNCETTSIIGCQFIGNFNNTLLGGVFIIFYS